MTLATLLLLQLANPSFEEGLQGWQRELGAQRGEGPTAQPGVVDGVLYCPVDPKARRWMMVTQVVPCRPNQRVILQARARCKNVRREGRQWSNANTLVIFLDKNGKRLGFAHSPFLRGDRDWIDLVLLALSPPGTARLKVGCFASMSGEVWFDEVRLRIDRAKALSAEALALHLDRNYPFLDFRKPEGDTAMAMLKSLHDLHVWVETPFGRVYTVSGNPHPPNWNEQATRAALTAIVLDKAPHLVGRTGPGGSVGYVRIGNFQNIDGIGAALDRLADAKSLLFDVRTNAGGNEMLARHIAARFTDRRVPYAKSQSRDPTRTGLAFQPPVTRYLDGKRKDPRPIVVLQGRHTVSSAEAFVAMMRELKHVTTMGQPTRGASGNPRPFPLAPGSKAWIPTWRALTLDGKPTEGVGLAPDVVVAGDCLDEALQRLR